MVAYPLKGPIDGVESYSSGFFAVVEHPEGLLLKLRKGSEFWDLPGGGPQSEEQLCAAPVLAQTVEFWTGMQVVRVREQIGGPVPGKMGKIFDTAQLYRVEAAGDLVPGKLTQEVRWVNKDSIVGLKLLGKPDQIGRMSLMISWALSIQQKPLVNRARRSRLPPAYADIQRAVICDGLISLAKEGSCLVLSTEHRIVIWRILVPVIRDYAIVDWQN